MKQEIMGFGDAMASAGPYANNLHIAPDINTLSLNIGWLLFLAPNQQCQSTEFNRYEMRK